MQGGLVDWIEDGEEHLQIAFDTCIGFYELYKLYSVYVYLNSKSVIMLHQ